MAKEGPKRRLAVNSAWLKRLQLLILVANCVHVLCLFRHQIGWYQIVGLMLTSGLYYVCYRSIAFAAGDLSRRMLLSCTALLIVDPQLDDVCCALAAPHYGNGELVDGGADLSASGGALEYYHGACAAALSSGWCAAGTPL